MPASYAVVSQTLTATGAGTTDFTSSGFGTPAAAIVFFSNGNTGTNPAATAILAAGFWDGTDQRAVAVSIADGVATSDTDRAQRNDYAAIYPSAGTLGAAFTASNITDGIRLTMSVDNTTTQRYATVVLLKGVSAKVLTFAPNATQNSTQASASLGFAPLAVLAISIGFTSGNTDSVAPAIISIGAATADGAHRWAAWSSADGAADAALTALFSETRFVGQALAGVVTWSAEVTTWGSDTFTATTRDGASGSDVCYVLALGGTDLKTALGTITTATSTGNTDTTTTGINPDVVLFGMTSSDTAGTVKTDGQASSFSVGAASSTVNAGYAVVDEDAAATMNAESEYSSTDAIRIRTSASGTGSTLVSGAVSMGSEKFTINYGTVSGTARKGWYLALGQDPSYVRPTILVTRQAVVRSRTW